MKVFWSWQSDTPGKTGRHVVRAALGEAVKQLLQGEDIYDAERDEDLHVDQDRQGVPGSPDLPATIIAKIEESAIFVADVTPVATTEGGKKVLNPNVGIELGYAWSRLGLGRILLVMNSAYGDHKAMPFDLQSKGGPIFYDLKVAASPKEIAAQTTQLTGRLVEAIRLILKNPVTGMNRPKHVPQPFGDNDGVFFKFAHVLAVDRHGRSHHMSPRKTVSIRMRPIFEQKPMTNHEALRAATHAALTPSQGSHPVVGENNEWGAISFSLDKDGRISSLAQLFRNKEIWGVDGTMIVDKSYLEDPDTRNVVLVADFVAFLESKIHLYASMAVHQLNIDGGVVFEVALSDCKGHALLMPQGHDQGMLHGNQKWSRTIADPSDSDKLDVAVDYFINQLFGAAGLPSPLTTR